MKQMCIGCKHCIHVGDSHDDPTGVCVYNPPTAMPGREFGVWPQVYLNARCSKWEKEEHV